MKGNLYEVPENKNAAKGERVKFTCATDHSDELLQWCYSPPGTNVKQLLSASSNIACTVDGPLFTIYSGFDIVGPLTPRLEIDNKKESESSKLIINNLQLSDAGTYVCIEGGEKNGSFAQLVVIGKSS